MVTFMNKAAAVHTGRNLSAVTPVGLHDLLPLAEGPEKGAPEISLGGAWKDGKTIAVEGYLLRATEEPLAVSGVAKPLLDAAGSPLGALVLLRDMTETMRVQRLTLETERLQVAAEMAAGIAHTMNNVLLIISGNAEALASHVPLERAGLVANIQTGARRAAELTARLMAFTDGLDENASSVDLNGIVRTAVARLGTLLSDADVRVELSPAPVMVRGGPDKILEIVEVILTNAREAVRDPGLVVVSTATETRGAETGDQAVMSITDNGVGMTPNVQRRLFTPFATTKILGRGLGLATARASVAARGGTMEIESAVGRGTTVRVRLPIAR